MAKESGSIGVLAKYLHEAFSAMTLQNERRWYRLTQAEKDVWMEHARDCATILTKGRINTSRTAQ